MTNKELLEDIKEAIKFHEGELNGLYRMHDKTADLIELEESSVAYDRRSINSEEKP